jgi:hypothetical protein
LDANRGFDRRRDAAIVMIVGVGLTLPAGTIVKLIFSGYLFKVVYE